MLSSALFGLAASGFGKQIISGIAINMMGLGLTSIYAAIFHVQGSLRVGRHPEDPFCFNPRAEKYSYLGKSWAAFMW
jgi:ABC-type uncharacterized transport system permease subunit